MNRVMTFLMAGGLGFFTDAGVLLALTVGAGLDPFLSRLVSFLLAVCTTWLINRTLTFEASGRTVAGEGLRYVCVAILVGLVNYGIYAGLILLVPYLWPLLALIIASGFATVLSWLGYSRLVFGCEADAISAPTMSPARAWQRGDVATRYRD